MLRFENWGRLAAELMKGVDDELMEIERGKLIEESRRVDGGWN